MQNTRQSEKQMTKKIDNNGMSSFLLTKLTQGVMKINKKQIIKHQLLISAAKIPRTRGISVKVQRCGDLSQQSEPKNIHQLINICAKYVKKKHKLIFFVTLICLLINKSLCF